MGLGSNATVLLGGSLVCVVHCSSQFLINVMPAKKFLISEKEPCTVLRRTSLAFLVADS